MDFFATRYYSNAQGRFTSTDPVYFQKAMLVDPQRFNLYSYVRNNPLKFIDPTGMILRIAVNGDPDTVKEWLQTLAGDLAGQLAFNAVKDSNGNIVAYDVQFNASGKEIGNNEGAKLVHDLVSSDKVFLAQASGEVEYRFTSGKGDGTVRKIQVDEEGGGNITRARTSAGREPTDPSIDSIIYVPRNIYYVNYKTREDVQPISDFIHEAAESYLLAQGVSYGAAHGTRYGHDEKGRFQKYLVHAQNAITREAYIRLQLDIKGSPAGEMLTKKP